MCKGDGFGGGPEVPKVAVLGREKRKRKELRDLRIGERVDSEKSRFFVVEVRGR